MTAQKAHRIYLDECGYPGEWVDIRARRSWAARQRVDAATIGQSQVVGNELRVMPDLMARALAMLEEAVVAWSLRDASGEPLPVGRGGFQHDDFDEHLGDWLVRAVEAYYDGQRRGQDERKNSGGPSTPPLNGAAAEGSPTGLSIS